MITTHFTDIFLHTMQRHLCTQKLHKISKNLNKFKNILSKKFTSNYNYAELPFYNTNDILAHCQFNSYSLHYCHAHPNNHYEIQGHTNAQKYNLKKKNNFKILCSHLHSHTNKGNHKNNNNTAHHSHQQHNRMQYNNT